MLSKEIIEDLRASIRGRVVSSDDADFRFMASVFNGNVMSAASLVVCPLDAHDVSSIVIFCSKHSLSPSVKAGGYGTAGWAIGGDVIIDLQLLNDLDIEGPGPDGSFTSLSDMIPNNTKGKKPMHPDEAAPRSTGKRRREDSDSPLNSYENASLIVSAFLRGEEISLDTRPSVRQRVAPGDTERIGNGRPETSTPGVVDTQTFASSADTGNASGSSGPANGNAAPSASPFGYLSQSSDEPSSGRNGTIGSGPVPIASLVTPYDAAPVASNTGPSIAYVTFGAGKRQKEVDTFTANRQLEVTAANNQTNLVPFHVPFSAHPVGSSVMILGGFGFMSRLHGLSIDNLVEVEMVLASGEIVIVNEKKHPDLWWALRGAGPALGIATRYKAKAHPVPSVYAGNIIYRFHQSTAPSLIRHFRDCVKGAPRELYANVLLTAGPPNQDSLVVIQMCYLGSKEKGQEFVSAISSWDGEKCLLNEVTEKNFLHQQDSVAQVLRGKAGRQWFIRSALITSLPDDIINDTVAQFADTPSGCTWLFEIAGGAIADYDDTCIPKSQRECPFTIAALHQWEMGVDDPRCVSSAEDWIAATLGPFQTGGPFPSFLGRHETAERTMSCYGDNWSRLRDVKQKYDPKNLFKNSLWPLDENGEAVEARTHEPATPPSC